MSINESDDRAAPVTPSRRRVSLRFVAGLILLGTTFGLVAVLVLLIVGTGSQPPGLTPKNFQTAQQRWNENGSANYDMDIQQSLGINGKIHVEVRAGQVTKMTINGALAQARLWDNWSVPGLFEIIGLDLSRNNDAAAQSQPAVLFQQADFDPTNGIPRDYRRMDLSTKQTAEWRITSFGTVP
jgi:hypothetical protein